MKNIIITENNLEEMKNNCRLLYKKVKDLESDFKSNIEKIVNTAYHNDNVKISVCINRLEKRYEKSSYNRDYIRIDLESNARSHDLSLVIYENEIRVNNCCIGDFNKEDLYLQMLILITKLFEHEKEFVDLSNNVDRAVISDYSDLYYAIDDYEKDIEKQKRELEYKQKVDIVSKDLKVNAIFEQQLDEYGRLYNSKYETYFSIISITDKNVLIRNIVDYKSKEWEGLYGNKYIINKEDFIRNLVNENYKFVELREIK